MKNVLLFSVFVCVAALLSLTLVSAVDTDKPRSITLLSVSELENGSYVGGIASLSLQINPGTGAIFLESYPLAKIDTQVATRLAQEVACSYTQVDCQAYDFFYTIRADAPIIGGPSAGAATALLTYAALEDINLKDDLAMTGAIGSGGVITPVAGVKEKVEAALAEGISTILIPLLSLDPYVHTDTIQELVLNASNTTQDENAQPTREPLSLEDIDVYGRSVIPVVNLHEAIDAAAMNGFPEQSQDPLEPPAYYLEQMGETAFALCNRTEQLFSLVKKNQHNRSAYESAREFYNTSLLLLSPQDAYSRASFCYSANVQLRTLVLEQLSQDVLNENYKRLISAQDEFDEQLEKKTLDTFSDLEAYVIVRERLLESRQFIDAINTSNISSSTLAAAIERYHSAVVWGRFFDLPGAPLVMDEQSLQRACLRQLEHVETRMNYLKTFLPEPFLVDVASELETTYEYAAQQEYALCLFKSTKARAHADMFLSTLGGATNESVAVITENKLARSEELIAREQRRDTFPLLGFSYYNYAQQLMDDDPYSALLFSEYALGLSDLSAYFPYEQSSLVQMRDNPSALFAFLTGFFLGLLVALLVAMWLRTRSMRKHQKRF